MMTQPFPTPVTGPFGAERTVEEHRNLYCSSYDRCLDHAVKEGWLGWSCTKCKAFADRTMDPEAQQFAHERRSDAFTR
ncbi:MAG: hypothetical protein ACT4TC_14285 [Myxococcaceae bacterium]